MATAVVTETRSEVAYRRFIEAVAVGAEDSVLTAHILLAGRYAADRGFVNTARMAFDVALERHERSGI